MKEVEKVFIESTSFKNSTKSTNAFGEFEPILSQNGIKTGFLIYYTSRQVSP